MPVFVPQYGLFPALWRTLLGTPNWSFNLNIKPALTLVTDPELIAKLEVIESFDAVKALGFPRAAKYNGVWMAYADDLRNYRKSGHRNPLEVVS